MSDLTARRRFTRHERCYLVKLVGVDSGIAMEGTTENISSGGAFIQLRRLRYAPEETLRLTIHASPLDPAPVTTDARIRWFCAGIGVQGYGVSFEPAPENVSRLAALVPQG